MTNAILRVRKLGGPEGQRFANRSSALQKRYHLKHHHLPPSTISLLDGESSDDEEEEDGEREQRERKKATEQSFCQICKGSKSPDLVRLKVKILIIILMLAKIQFINLLI